MGVSRVDHLARRARPVLLAILLTLFLVAATSLTSFADKVRISDPVQALNVSSVTSAGAKLAYPLDIYTTSTYTGSSSDFVNRTVKLHLTSSRLIVIAIDTTHRYLAIVGGKSVPLSTSQYNAAGSAFKNAVSGNHYTDAAIAAIQSLASSLGSSSSSSGKGSGLMAGIIIVGIIVLIIIVVIFKFVRRLLGFTPPPLRPRPPSTPRYGDGRDNLGGGTAGSF